MFAQIFLEGFHGKQNKQESQSNVGKLFSLLTSAQTLHVTGTEGPYQAGSIHPSLQQLVAPIVLLTGGQPTKTAPWNVKVLWGETSHNPQTTRVGRR